jgi:hypothetical protein
MAGSPIQQLLDAVDTLDVDQVMALAAPSPRILIADGRRAQGTEGVRALLGELLATLRVATHRVTAEWRQQDVWIAEVDASYELRDGTQTATLPRAVIGHFGPDGVSELHIYGAHEHPLEEQDEAQGGLILGGRWIPPL